MWLSGKLSARLYPGRQAGGQGRQVGRTGDKDCNRGVCDRQHAWTLARTDGRTDGPVGETVGAVLGAPVGRTVGMVGTRVGGS